MKKEKITKGVKAFNKDMTCNNFKYEEGKTFEMEGKPERCNRGFHFCENPLDTFRYYVPASSVFHEVEGIGETSTDDDDSKVAVTKIKNGANISLHSLIESGIKFIFERTILTKESTNKEPQKQASNSGNSGAASNSGNSGAASNSGYSGAAMTTGIYSTAETTVDNSIACAFGIKSTVKGALNSWIVAAEFIEKDSEWRIKTVKSALVDGKKIKADTLYQLVNGKFTEV